MAKRKRKAINGWMLRKRGIFRRWAQASTAKKPKYYRDPSMPMPQRPKADKLGTVMHDVPPSKRMSIEKIRTETKRLEVNVEVDWTSYRHSGLTHFNYKLLESRGRPPWYELRVYFHGDEVLFIEIVHGEARRITEVYERLESAIALYKKWGKEGLRWKEE